MYCYPRPGVFTEILYKDIARIVRLHKREEMHPVDKLVFMVESMKNAALQHKSLV